MISCWYMATSTCPTSPSSASACAVLDGEPGAIPRFLGHWLLRSALIMPGFALVGLRDKRLITGAFAGSTMISLFLVLHTALQPKSVAEGTVSIALLELNPASRLEPRIKPYEYRAKLVVRPVQ